MKSVSLSFFHETLGSVPLLRWRLMMKSKNSIIFLQVSLSYILQYFRMQQGFPDTVGCHFYEFSTRGKKKEQKKEKERLDRNIFWWYFKKINLRSSSEK